MEKNLNIGNDQNLFDIIEQVFALISGYQIDICTFSISDDGVRFLAHLDENIMNLKCRIIVDSSALKTKTNVIFSANKVAEVRFASNHAKIIVVRGEFASAYIITSSNFNLTKRNEQLLFGFEKDIVDQLSDFYEKLWHDGIQQ